jgi:hypothetical protein
MSFKRAIGLVLVVEGALALLALIYYGGTIENLQAVTRYSGRFSLTLFSAIFLLQKNKPMLERLLSKQYYAIFAIAHAIHLAELLSYVYLSGIPLVPHRLAGGFLAYMFIFAMPFLQVAVEKGSLSEKRFATIQYIYLYYVWFVFFMTYLARVQGTFPNAGGSYAEHVALLAWVSLMLGISFSRVLQRPNRAQTK